jgi:hypothetical protein
MQEDHGSAAAISRGKSARQGFCQGEIDGSADMQDIILAVRIGV